MPWETCRGVLFGCGVIHNKGFFMATEQRSMWGVSVLHVQQAVHEMGRLSGARTDTDLLFDKGTLGMWNGILLALYKGARHFPTESPKLRQRAKTVTNVPNARNRSLDTDPTSDFRQHRLSAPTTHTNPQDQGWFWGWETRGRVISSPCLLCTR